METLAPFKPKLHILISSVQQNKNFKSIRQSAFGYFKLLGRYKQGI